MEPELRDELKRLIPETSDHPSQTELRITQGQLVGWLEGVFQGIKTGLLLLQQSAGPEGQNPIRPGSAERPPEAGPYL
ncbi:proteasome activator [Nonomuraea jiangxiensis]|uniref:Bacterial proteasome activator n=1 Tax=Nonomuraea jiangxiensis TaxID=633440 RepID=A0A1G9WCK6_9ACTN|nr:proteasome activator [Nonomuraea jiangxiensis]SDM82229.1 Protein of unknown function [Nonomuraea jiangxiensis]